MNPRCMVAALALAAASAIQLPTAHAEDVEDAEDAASSPLDQVLQKWPPRPRLAAYRMISRYGAPAEVSPSQLVWHHEPPWKRIVVMRDEIPHHGPSPHVDYLAQTLDYRVPTRKVDDLAAFDGSLHVDRTAGELTARCNSEAKNLLVLNLAHDIVIGRRSELDARTALADLERAWLEGQPHPYSVALQFVPGTEPAREVEPASAPARRPAPAASAPLGEALGLLVAIAETQVENHAHAARHAGQPAVRELAGLLFEGGSRGRAATLGLAQRLGANPVEGAAASEFRAEDSASLARVLQQEGETYGDAYVNHVVRSLLRVLDALDRLLRTMNDPELRSHLELVRGIAAAQLNQALALGKRGES
jgi:hypothetical protein